MSKTLENALKTYEESSTKELKASYRKLENAPHPNHEKKGTIQ